MVLSRSATFILSQPVARKWNGNLKAASNSFPYELLVSLWVGQRCPHALRSHARVMYRAGIVQVDGDISIRVFDGTITMRDLRL